MFKISDWMRERADESRERVRVWFVRNPMGTQKECAAALKLNVNTVNRKVREIRDGH